MIPSQISSKAVDAIANRCHSRGGEPPRASGMLTIIKAGCDWFSSSSFGSVCTFCPSFGGVVMATTTGLRMGGFGGSSAPAALSSRSSGYCERCTRARRKSRWSGWPASRAGSAGLCRCEDSQEALFWRGCVAFLKAGAPPKLIFFSIARITGFRHS